MKSLFIQDTLSKIGETVTLYGWADTIRDHKKVIFIDLRDSTGIIQTVGTEDIGKKMAGVSVEDVIAVTGLIKKRPDNMVNDKSSLGSIELEASDINIISHAAPLPFDISKESLDLTLPVLLDNRSLTLRHPKIREIFKVQETIIDAFRRACKAKHFTEFQAPVIIPEVAEGGAEVFEVKYFGHKAFLSQSPQFYKQIMITIFERVFTVNKTLRAEPSVTTRHLTEATTLDAELGFIDSWTELMDMAEYVIKYLCDAVKKENILALGLYTVDMPDTSLPIPRLKLREGQEIIFKRTGRDNRAEPDLEPEDERELCRWAQEEHGINMVFVTHYPVAKRPFYTFEDSEDPGYTLSFDLLGFGLEWLTGGQRIHDYETLMKKAQDRGMNMEKIELYLQAFRYGMPPEGGFSFGSERIVMGLLGLQNVREASLFPRDMERIDVHLPSLK
ncbi:aspartate--tRNA(Asn) ligase [Candidatus Roizmanbacteria bacterium RIFCSPHIGHO2_02_FULL_43_11]|uniref:Aspartate--tRNA(Asn) ligase n=1 Tax=Candidatus Roizmanbacteria bacterium RIFCSPHIGHO2_02_FULL_43_11 TaxID=1802043 RepID=A0A1F7HFV7_9BACT|nr:MAG: aspartate--tRNA(Asn) ligase [Candidatus Roizmanbacteria bacterium RIFCSPHIGHO2_02_FULL_43_11]